MFVFILWLDLIKILNCDHVTIFDIKKIAVKFSWYNLDRYNLQSGQRLYQVHLTAIIFNIKDTN